jgi:predicted nucleotidyltransferase
MNLPNRRIGKQGPVKFYSILTPLMSAHPPPEEQVRIMNQETETFLEELKQKPEVLGVILFGSWARGNNRPDSDVDLVVILTNGYKRTVEYKNNQAFEITYATEKSAFEYWESHKDDAAGLWEVAKVLYDKDGTIKQLQEKTQEMLKADKKPIDEFQLGQFRFDAEDQLKYVESVLDTDPTTANLILTNKVFALTELFFDIRQLWTPAPKQRLGKIKEISSGFYSLLQNFYQENIAIKDKLDVARKIIPLVFEH